jgi:UDP-N-acetylglucosamine diphosphorylase/glucosamine-1-phosphate N-acetyltransferase|tara:strand:+ start:13450 stop:14664 length:1215 start_codon:yes stop_codon:yes gene_type:complete
MIKNALILAAGKGTRMWPLTENNPKPLLPIGGLPIIERQIYELKKIGVENIHILIGYQMKDISDKLKNGKEYGVHINYITQEEQKGTGHAVVQAKGIIEDRFYCINGDMIINAENLRNLNQDNDHLAMMVTEVEDCSNFGVVESQNNYLVSIIEKGVKGKGTVNAGSYIFDKRIFKAIDGIGKSIRGEYELTDALQSIAEEIRIVNHIGFWKDIGSPWDLITANEIYMENIIELNQGTIENNVTIKGDLYLGENSIIKAGTYIEGPVWIGKNCIIGPNAYLRKGTVLCGSNKVGASSEVKNSILMEGAKAPHHNYVGDSIIGKNSNLGSGTKIANLRLDKKTINIIHKGKKIDSGRRKLGAIIGDNVNTGINTSINAGTILGSYVKIGPNASVSGTYESQSTII